MFKSAKVRYVDTSKSSSIKDIVYYNNGLASDSAKVSITMQKTNIPHTYGFYDDNVHDVVNTEELQVGDIIIVKNYYPRYISKKVASTTHSYDFEFTLINQIHIADKARSDISTASATKTSYAAVGKLLIQ